MAPPSAWPTVAANRLKAGKGVRQSFTKLYGGTKVLKVVSLMPETKTRRRPAAKSKAATRELADKIDGLAQNGGPSKSSQGASYEFVDRMMELNRTGELRSPVSQTLEMNLVEFARGEAI